MGADSYRAENGEERPHTANQVCLPSFFVLYGVWIHSAIVLILIHHKPTLCICMKYYGYALIYLYISTTKRPNYAHTNISYRITLCFRNTVFYACLLFSFMQEHM